MVKYTKNKILKFYCLHIIDKQQKNKQRQSMTIFLEDLLINDYQLSPRELYLNLNQRGNGKHNSGGLGLLDDSHPLAKKINAAFTIDHEKRMLQVKDPYKLLELAALFECGEDEAPHTNKNSYKAALCYALIIHLAKHDPENIHKELIPLAVKHLNEALNQDDIGFDKSECVRLREQYLEKYLQENAGSSASLHAEDTHSSNHLSPLKRLEQQIRKLSSVIAQRLFDHDHSIREKQQLEEQERTNAAQRLTTAATELATLQAKVTDLEGKLATAQQQLERSSHPQTTETTAAATIEATEVVKFPDAYTWFKSISLEGLNGITVTNESLDEKCKNSDIHAAKPILAARVKDAFKLLTVPELMACLDYMQRVSTILKPHHGKVHPVVIEILRRETGSGQYVLGHKPQTWRDLMTDLETRINGMRKPAFQAF